MNMKEKVKEAFNAFLDGTTLEPTEVKFELNAPDGDYVSADGGIITVSANSVSYAEAPEATEEEVVEEEMAQEPTEMEAEEAKPSEAEIKLSSALEEIEKLTKKVEELSKVEPISKAPQKPAERVQLEVTPQMTVAQKTFTNFLNLKNK